MNNNDPISTKERRKARAMVRDISKQIRLFEEWATPDEWWLFIFSCLYGQELVENPFRQELPSAPMFVVRNNKRTADLTVSTGAQLITLLYAFGNTRRRVVVEVVYDPGEWNDALMAAVMTEAFRENKYRDAGRCHQVGAVRALRARPIMLRTSARVVRGLSRQTKRGGVCA
jgi:hypothetical protein